MNRTRIPDEGSYDDFKKAVMELPYTLANERVLEETGAVEHGCIHLDWLPMRRGTLSGVIGPCCVNDTMDGMVSLHLNFDTLVCHLPIDYATGVISGFPPHMEGRLYNLTYWFDSGDTSKYVAQLRRRPVVGRTTVFMF